MHLAATPETTSTELGALAPLRLPEDLRLTPEQFARVCAANPEAVLELAADGRLMTMIPTGSETGARSFALSVQLWQAARRAGLAVKLFDSSTGFHLPDDSVLSPRADSKCVTGPLAGAASMG